MAGKLDPVVPDEMEIRKAKKSEIRTIAEIFRLESSKPPYNKKRTLNKALNRIKEDFRSNDLYVAIINNKIIGFVMVQRDSGKKEQLWINELWILKEYQRNGIGKKVMNEIEKIYRNRGIKVFKLVADTNIGGALKFYKKVGYKVDNNSVFMEKKIK